MATKKNLKKDKLLELLSRVLDECGRASRLDGPAAEALLRSDVLIEAQDVVDAWREKRREARRAAEASILQILAAGPAGALRLVGDAPNLGLALETLTRLERSGRIKKTGESLAGPIYSLA